MQNRLTDLFTAAPGPNRAGRSFIRGISIGFLAMALVLILTACGATRYGPGWDRAGTEEDSCPIVRVNNNTFDRVVLRNARLGTRMGSVGGYSRGEFSDCDLVGQPTVFVVDPVGAEPYTVQGHTALDFGSDIEINLESNRGLNTVIGNGEGFGGDRGDLEILGYRPLDVIPNTYYGVFLDMLMCTGMQLGEEPIAFDDIDWGIAYSLRDTEDNRLMYGAFLMGGPFPNPTIIFEFGYTGHLTVVSHEILHALGYGEDSPQVFGCTITFPGSDLMERWGSGE